jgi:hypothetical protein
MLDRMGNYTVWPVVKSLKQVSQSFPFTLTGDQTMHRFIWSRDEVIIHDFKFTPE